MGEGRNESGLVKAPEPIRLSGWLPEPADYLIEAGRGLFTSLPVQTPSDKEFIYRALTGEPLKLGELIGEAFQWANILVHPAMTMNEDTGEVREWLRTLLFTPEGANYSCGSQGILKSIGLYSTLVRRPPWNPPWHCKLKRKVIGQKQWFYFE